MSAPVTGPGPRPSSLTAAARRLAAIRGAIGDDALRLAYHAAVPVAVDAGLLNLLRVNFFLDGPLDVLPFGTGTGAGTRAGTEAELLPFETEAELLLSPLFREIGEGLYEIDPGVRNLLLSGLYSRYGGARVHRVAALLEQYTDASAAWRSLPELELAQRLTALGFLDPAAARHWLDERAGRAGRASAAGDAGPSREWYVAMQRRMDENEARSDIGSEVVATGRALMGLVDSDTVNVRLALIRDLRVLAGLPGADTQQVVTVLSAFIESWGRDSAPASPKAVTPDVQAALTLIGSVPHTSIFLKDVSLRDMNLAGLDFSHSDFDRVMLSEADAAGINLSWSRFVDVALVDVNLAGARLNSTLFDRATLSQADARGVDLGRSRFTDVSLVDVDLDGARLDHADLRFRLLRNVTMHDVLNSGTRIECDTNSNVSGSTADGTPLFFYARPTDEDPPVAATVTPPESPAEASTAPASPGMDALLKITKNVDVTELYKVFEAALAEIRVERDPADRADALLKLARPLLSGGHLVEALTVLSEARTAIQLSADPARSAQIQVQLGRYFTDLDRFAEAEAAYRDALRADSSLAAAHSGLGAALLAGGRYAEALDVFNEAFRLNPADTSLYPGLGEALQRAGRAAEAVGSVRSGSHRASGFWTGPRTFVTAAHAVPVDHVPFVTFRTWSGEEREAEMRVLWLDGKRDVAVLGARGGLPVASAWLSMFADSGSMDLAERVLMPVASREVITGRWSGATTFSGDTDTIRGRISLGRISLDSLSVPLGLSGTPVIRNRDGVVVGMVVGWLGSGPEEGGPKEVSVLVAETVVDGLRQAPRVANVTLMRARSAGSSAPVAEPAPLRVFVSSPYSPRMTPYRQAAAEVCDQLGMVQVSLDDIDPMVSAREAIRQAVDSSDVLVLLLADRYGTPPTGERLSYTELEYDRAVESGIPVLAFVGDWQPQAETSPDKAVSDLGATQPAPDVDAESDAAELRRFRERLLFRLVLPLLDAESIRQSLTEALTQLADRRASGAP